MNVWKSDEKVKLLIFASLISPSKIILLELNKYQVSDTVFVKNNSTTRRTSTLLSVFQSVQKSLLLVSRSCSKRIY